MFALQEKENIKTSEIKTFLFYNKKLFVYSTKVVNFI